MSLRYIRHLGNWNPDHVSIVKVSPALVNYGDCGRYKDGPKKGRPKARRPWVWWGKPQRAWGGSLYIDGYRRKPAEVLIWQVGDGHPLRLDCHHDKEAERWAAEIRADLAEGVGTERIVAAAVKRMELNRAWTPNDGDHEGVWMTYTQPAPARHHHILHSMPGDSLNVIQGFLTSTGRFVGRKEAWSLAVAAGQLVPKPGASVPDLFSEDLW